MTYILVLDTETTGLGPGTGPIEVAAIMVDTSLREQERFHRMIRPDGLIWEKIAFEMNSGRVDWSAPSLDDVLTDLARFARTYMDSVDEFHDIHLAGSNPGFDRRMLGGLPWAHHRMIDTGSLLAPYWLNGLIPGTGIKHGRGLLQIPGEQAHTAMKDCEDALAILRRTVTDHRDHVLETYYADDD